MAKSKKTVEAVKDIKELNWEETDVSLKQQKEENAALKQQETGSLFIGLPETYGRWQQSNLGAYEWSVDQVLNHLIDQVDPELKQGNPVWHWALCDDHCTFVFRNGQKVTVKI